MCSMLYFLFRQKEIGNLKHLSAKGYICNIIYIIIYVLKENYGCNLRCNCACRAGIGENFSIIPETGGDNCNRTEGESLIQRSTVIRMSEPTLAPSGCLSG